jgi:adenosylmethionine-8-amino-7-oxononanoate aminotransferase
MQDKIMTLHAALEALKDLTHVGNIRQCGFMVGIEIVKDKATKEPYAPGERMGHKVCMTVREFGVIIRPLGDVVVLMPPLCVTHDEIKQLVEVTGKSIKMVTG